MPEKALQWGSDFIDGLVKGITSSVGGVVDAVKGVGEKIKSFLHFSVPDKGPLTEYESWMPDFMAGLGRGIEDNEDMVLDKIRSLAGGIKMLMTAANATIPTVMGAAGGGTHSMVQNVNISNS